MGQRMNDIDSNVRITHNERENESNGKKMVDKEAEQSMPRDIISRILLSFYSEPAFK